MQAIADELCQTHEYGLMKKLMKEVRRLEADIVKY